jgi:hypothetical protein
MERHFLLVVTSAALAATPAAAQTVAQAVETVKSGTQSATPIPDFSGIWGHLAWPDVEPPLSGPGPVRNRSRRDGVSDTYRLVGDYSNPILKSQAAELVKRHAEISLAGGGYPTRATSVGPAGSPLFFGILACKCSSSQTRSGFSIPTIMKYATCA